jgi:hypothetical protein
MSDAPRIVYSPRPDATPEAERSVLGSVYRFILNCQTCEKGAQQLPPMTTQQSSRGGGLAVRICNSKLD